MTAKITRTGSIWSVLPGIWSGRRDSNPGSHAPKACALARLRYAPRAGFYGDRLTGGGWGDGQLLRPVISAVGRRIDHVIPAGVPGEHPTRRDADEGRSERLRRVVDPLGAAHWMSVAWGRFGCWSGRCSTLLQLCPRSVFRYMKTPSGVPIHPWAGSLKHTVCGFDGPPSVDQVDPPS